MRSPWLCLEGQSRRSTKRCKWKLICRTNYSRYSKLAQAIDYSKIFATHIVSMSFDDRIIPYGASNNILTENALTFGSKSFDRIWELFWQTMSAWICSSWSRMTNARGQTKSLSLGYIITWRSIKSIKCHHINGLTLRSTRRIKDLLMLHHAKLDWVKVSRS